MPIIAKASGSGDFQPAPEGVYPAVCCDVVDKGQVSGVWQGKPTNRHVVQIRWQLDGNEAGIMDDGKPWLIVRSFTLSLHEKSKLRPFLEAWRGVKFKDADLADGFDVEKLIGANCMVQILHDLSDDGQRTFANVASIMPPLKGATKLVPLDYIRAKFRGETAQEEPGDDELAF